MIRGSVIVASNKCIRGLVEIIKKERKNKSTCKGWQIIGISKSKNVDREWQSHIVVKRNLLKF